MSDDSLTLAVATERGLTLWDVTDKERPVPLLPALTSLQFPNRFEALAFSPSGHHLAATIPQVNVTSLFSFDTRKELRTVLMRGRPWSLAFSPDGRGLAIGRACGLIFYCRD